MALEYKADWQPAIDAWLASDGGDAARADLLALPIWRQEFQDGRSSAAFLRLFESLRRMKQAGTITGVRATDIGKEESGERDAAMARHCMAAAASANGIILALVGNVHAMRVPMKRPTFTIVTAASLLPPTQTVTVDVVANGGMAWACQSDGCGPHSNGPSRVEKPGIRDQPADAPWHLAYELGRPTTASPPAIPAPPVWRPQQIGPGK